MTNKSKSDVYCAQGQQALLPAAASINWMRRRLGRWCVRRWETGYQIFGLIYDIHIDDDGLVRQLVTADNVSDEVMKDNRERRIVPVEMSVLAVGYEQDGKIFHLLPPRPPLSLDVIYLCDDKDMARFTEQFRVFQAYLE